MRLILIISCILAVMPASSFASSDDQLQDCIGALNAIAKVIDKDKPRLNSDYVRALYGHVLMNRAIEKEPAMDSGVIGNPSDIRSCFALDIDKKHLEVLLKAYHGQLSSDPAEDLAYCYAVITSLESELVKALGEDIGLQVATKLGQDFGNVYAFVTRLYREPTVWEIERRATEITKANSAEQLAANRYVCEWYSVPVSAVTIAAVITARASARQTN